MKKRVFKVVSEIMDVPIESININSSPDDIATWDSFKHMNLILALEEEFNVNFKEEDMVELLNVELIIIKLKELLN